MAHYAKEGPEREALFGDAQLQTRRLLEGKSFVDEDAVKEAIVAAGIAEDSHNSTIALEIGPDGTPQFPDTSKDDRVFQEDVTIGGEVVPVNITFGFEGKAGNKFVVRSVEILKKVG